jgi:pSer/pThr/pTyr-binding forkhead associated (FHA) protein
MLVILEAIHGPGAGKKIVLRQGQLVTVGRTEWADVSLAADAAIADIHFEVEYGRQGCRVRDLNTVAGTLVNGAKITRPVFLHTGDQLTAGESTFAVTVEGELPPAEVLDATTRPPAEMAAAAEQTAPAPQFAADYCRQLELGEEAQQLLSENLMPADYVGLLARYELFSDAIFFLAFWLPKPKAVAWGYTCVRDVYGDQLGPDENDALELAQKWAADPNEENRRAAGTAAETTNFDGAASWVAVGAFWSGGSLAPPDLPEAPPAPELTARAITGALLMAAAHGDVLKTNGRYQAFLTRGAKLATG